MLGPGPSNITFWEPGEAMVDGIEYWAFIKGYKSAYLVSTEGQVMRIAGGRGTKPGTVQHGYILKATPNSRGYPTVKLSVGGQRHTEKVHLLVERTFAAIAQDRYGPHEVHHGDGNSKNNALWNLKPGSAKEHAEWEYNRRMSARGN